MSHPLVIRSAARAVSDSVIPLSTAQLMRRHLVGLREALPFDAAQLLVFDRSNDRHWQMAQIGYSASIARILAEDFTKDWPLPVWYPIEPGDDLPPTISAEQDLPGSFRRSAIYEGHLGPAEYLDGLTLELNHRGRYVGLANFSSYAEHFYTTELRRRSLAFASLLGHAVNATARELEAVPPSACVSAIDESGASNGLAGREPSTLATRPDFVDAIRPVFSSPQRRLIPDCTRRPTPRQGRPHVDRRAARLHRQRTAQTVT